MSKPADVYFVRGQGDQTTSTSIDWMANEVVGWNIGGSRVRTYNWWQWQQMRDDINSRLNLDVLRLAVAFSMGANCFTWTLGGVVDHEGRSAPGIKSGTFEHITLIDPTWASVLTPISGNRVRQVKHYYGTFPDIVGKGRPTYTPPRPQVDQEDVFVEHLFIPFFPPVRSWTLGNLRRMMTS